MVSSPEAYLLLQLYVLLQLGQVIQKLLLLVFVKRDGFIQLPVQQWDKERVGVRSIARTEKSAVFIRFNVTKAESFLSSLLLFELVNALFECVITGSNESAIQSQSTESHIRNVFVPPL